MEIARRQRLSPTSWGLVFLALAVLTAGAIWMRRHNPENGWSYMPRCTFQSLTNLQCPGCGGTRATYHLLHGNVGSAFYYNALWVVSVPFLALILARRLWWWWHRQAAPDISGWRRLVAILWLSSLFVFWIVRNTPLWPWL